MSRHRPLDEQGVEAVVARDDVTQRLAGLHVQEERGVARVRVEIDERHVALDGAERDGEVHGDRGRTDATFRTVDDPQLAPVALGSAAGLGELDADLEQIVLAERQREMLVGARSERADDGVGIVVGRDRDQVVTALPPPETLDHRDAGAEIVVEDDDREVEILGRSERLAVPGRAAREHEVRQAREHGRHASRGGAVAAHAEHPQRFGRSSAHVSSASSTQRPLCHGAGRVRSMGV
jgi:hypothetical protein